MRDRRVREYARATRHRRLYREQTMIDALHLALSLLNVALDVAVRHGAGGLPPVTC
jgi:hypothetical protein